MIHLPYLIYAPDYTHASSGIKVLHKLSHELNLVGEEAYVGFCGVTNPEWNTPKAEPSWFGIAEYIAVYPEVVWNNPWNALKVARWVLNAPGKLGGTTTYDPSEMVFSWHKQFLDDVPLLNLPAIELDIYNDFHYGNRKGIAYYVGKGEITNRIDGLIEITQAMREDRYWLADLLNSVKLLYCYDDVTAMVDIARLCGCPALVIPTGKLYTPEGYREEYLREAVKFPVQLQEFIRITQS